MHVDPKIIARIQKMLTLGDKDRNPSEEEAMQAMAAARSLLDKYRLSLADVEGAGAEEVKGNFSASDVVEEHADVRQRSRGYWTWEKWLMVAVENLTVTSCFLHQTSSIKRVIYVGLPADVAVAKELWNMLSSAIRKGANENCGGSRWSPSHRCYAEGFARAVGARARELNRKDTDHQIGTGTALMVIKNQAKAVVRSYMEQNHGDLRAGRRGGNRGQFDPYAYKAGQKDGNSHNLGIRNQLKK